MTERRRRRRWSLRLRITAGALVVVVGALTAAGLVVIGVTEREMTDQIDAALRADADFTERMVTRGSGLPMGEGPTDLYVQFVDGAGDVAGAGTAAIGRPALSVPGQANGEVVTVVDPELGELRVLTTAAPNNPTLTLVLARSSQNVTEVHQTLIRLLTVLVIAGSFLLSLLVWLVVGRSLRPVEQMRRTVEDLDDGDLATRVELPGTGDELDRLAGTLNALLARLEVAVEREHRFVADASHDLRTPIAAMRALLETEAADPSLVVLTRADALARLDQLQVLVDQLVALAGAEATEPPSNPVDLDELVLGEARQLARHTRLRVDTSRVSGGQVAGRDTDLVRLVENLATNAARYSATTVSFTVHQFGDTVELIIDDDGPGIAPADRDRIFERFATLDDARTDLGSGAGLGLAIVAAIVSAHHGTIRVGDAPGGGARFEVRLPAFDPPPPPARRPAAPATRQRG
jgi:signal transduction histidine kinase